MVAASKNFAMLNFTFGTVSCYNWRIAGINFSFKMLWDILPITVFAICIAVIHRWHFELAINSVNFVVKIFSNQSYPNYDLISIKLVIDLSLIEYTMSESISTLIDSSFSWNKSWSIISAILGKNSIVEYHTLHYLSQHNSKIL